MGVRGEESEVWGVRGVGRVRCGGERGEESEVWG